MFHLQRNFIFVGIKKKYKDTLSAVAMYWVYDYAADYTRLNIF